MKWTALMLAALVASSSANLPDLPNPKLPPQTNEGSFVGTWFYVDTGYRIAIFIAPDKTGILKMRYKLHSRTGLDFETDARGFTRYLEDGVPVELLFAGTPNADQTEIRGHYRRVATSKLSKREESGNFRIYRSSHGRAIVLHYPEYTVHVTSATTRPKITTQSDVLMVFSKASEMIIDFSEIPF